LDASAPGSNHVEYYKWMVVSDLICSMHSETDNAHDAASPSMLSVASNTNGPPVHPGGFSRPKLAGQTTEVGVI